MGMRCASIWRARCTLCPLVGGGRQSELLLGHGLLVLQLLAAGEHLGLRVVLERGHDLGVDAVADDLQRKDAERGAARVG